MSTPRQAPTSDEAPLRADILRSWKEIATVLGVTVRSAQRWEKTAALPVYRRAGADRGPVFAYEGELRRWMESGAAPEECADEVAVSTAPVAAQSVWRHWLGGALVACGVLAVVAAALVWWRAPGRPASWHIDRDVLRVFDDQQRLCWERHIANGEAEYDSLVHDKALVADIDGDGNTEVLYHRVPKELAAESSTLVCLDAHGRERWRHRYGEVKRFGSREFSAVYRAAFVRSVTAGGRRYVLAAANHHLWYPSVVELLDPSTGRTLEQYWHPGSLYSCLIADLDGDQQPEALFAAVNNPGEGLGHAALAALKLPFSRTPHMQRVQKEDARYPALTGGGEWAYVLFPRSDMSTAMGQMPIPVRFSLDHDSILFEAPFPYEGGIVYTFDRQFNLRECRFSDAFAVMHKRLEVQGHLRHALNEPEQAALRRIARFNAAPDSNSRAVAALWPELP